MNLEGKQSFEEFSSKRKPEPCYGMTDEEDEYGRSKSYLGDGNAAPSQASTGGASGKRMRSRWEFQNEAETAAGESTPKRKKSRRAGDDSKFLKILGPIQLPDFTTDLPGEDDNDPEVRTLRMQLSEIGRRLQVGQRLGDSVDVSISPPETVYDNQGVRINRREFRLRQKLTRRRLEIISKMIQKDPTFDRPVDYKPPRLYKKLYIPVKRYPHYNFIGLIIGPRGNTQKRMENETGAKIIIRGKGSMKERKKQKKSDLKFDFSENEDLHVFIEAETQRSVDAAVSKVEKLLVPVEERLNEHKQAQLRELAELNATVKHDGFCTLRGEQGRHGHSTSQSLDLGYPSIGWPSKSLTKRSRMAGERRTSLAEQGCRGSSRGGLVGQTSPDQSAASAVASWGDNSLFVNYSGSNILSESSNIGSTPKPIHDYNGVGVNMYVGYLPQAIDSEQLMHLFSRFGRVLEAKVIKNRKTGLSKGYGFVKYADETTAFCAATHMNGCRLEGRVLVVRIAARAPPTGAVGQVLRSGDTEQSASFLLSSPIVDSYTWYGPPWRLPSSYSSCDNAGIFPSSGHVDTKNSFSRQQFSSSYGAHACVENACASWHEFRPYW
ncbi:unnamed protein product [Victoria cruziana]